MWHTHLYTIMWSGKTLYILARRDNYGNCTIESINGFPVDHFPDSARKAAMAHFKKIE